MKHLFLDLEDTVITPVVDGWNRFELINLDKIRWIIRDFEPELISVFSFAVWDEHQLKLFNTHCRPHVERELGVSFALVPTVDHDIIGACCREMKLSPSTVDFQEASNFWSKQGAFRHFAKQLIQGFRNHRPNEHVHLLLLDDVVFDEQLFWPRLNAIVQQLNIDEFTDHEPTTNNQE